MSAAAQLINVTVTGDSAQLSKAVDKCVTSLKLLGDTSTKIAKQAMVNNDAIIKSNQAVATSYSKVVEAVQASSGKILAATDKQTTAVRNSATVTSEATAKQVTSYKNLSKAAAETATSVQVSSDKQARSVIAASDASVLASSRASKAAVDSAAKQKAAFTSTATAIGDFGKKAVLGLGVVGVAGLDLSMKFEKRLHLLQTQAGASSKEVEKIGPALKAMAGEVGATPDQLAEGMYHVVSSMRAVLPEANRVNEMLHIQREAAKLAAIGNTNIAETTYTVVSGMNALGLSGKDANKFIGEMNATVGSGDMTMQDLEDTMKSGVLPTAKMFGTSFQSVGAALAVFGDEGIKGAAAGTKLRMMFALLGGPTKKSAEILSAIGVPAGEIKTKFSGMSKALAEAGVSTTQVAEDLRKPNGLSVALTDLKDHLEKSGMSATAAAAVITRAFGGGRTSAGITMLLESLPRLNAKYKEIGQTSGEVNKDWGIKQEELSFKIKQTEASILALGTTLGHDLEPVAKTVLKDLDTMIEFFKHNDAAARELAHTVEYVLGAALTIFVGVQIAKMIEGFKKLGLAYQYLNNGFAAKSVGASAIGGAGGPVSALGGGIVGARGPEGAGSLINPIVVAIEDGQYAGLGGRGAALTSSLGKAEGAASTVASDATHSGIILPPGVSAGESAATKVAPTASEVFAAANPATEAVVTTGVMNTVKASAGKLMAGVVKGGLIALGGTMASELAGTVIGGKTGSAVSGIGKDAAIGAGLGSFLGPEGLLAGGVLGGLVGGFKSFEAKSKEYGESFAHGFVSPLEPLVGQAVAKAQETKLHGGLKKQHEDEHPQTGKQWFEEVFDPFGLEGHHGTVDQQKVNADIKKNAETAKETFVKGWSTVKFPTADIFGKDAIASLNGLQGVTRLAAAKAMISYATELEKQGHLPKGSVEKIIKTLEAQFPQLATYAEAQGLATAKSFANALNLTEAEKNVKGVLNNITKEFGILPTSVGATMKDLEHIVTHSTGSTKTAAEHDLHNLQTAYGREWAAIREHVTNNAKGAESAIATLSHNLPALGAPGYEKYADLVTQWAAHLSERVGWGVEHVDTGVAKINKMLEGELGALGMPKQVAQHLVTGHGSESLRESPFAGHAQGGLIQLGNAGERGQDSIPFMAGGMPVLAAPGEQVAVFTHQQQAVANEALAGIGGLPGLFSQHSTPHYMAQGGFVQGPGTNYTYGEEPQIRADLQRLGEYLHVTLRGISGYRSPAHSIAVGGFPNDPHTRGEASDTEGTQNIPESVLEKFGLTRPFPGAAEADHMQLLSGGKGAGAPGSTSGGGNGASVTAPTWNTIHAPHVGGSGAISQIAQAALNKVAGAANKYGEAHMGSASSAGSAGGHAAGSAQMKAWAKAGLEAAGVPATPGNISAIVYTMTRESGGNPRSENTTDSNARAGHPSRGLMELIPENFSKYHVPGTSNNVFDPVANVAASARYMLARYGHIVGMSPYERGGFIGAAKGLAPKSVHHAKPRGTGGKNTKHPAHSPKPSFGSLIKGLSSVPGIENIKGLVQPEARLKTLGEEQANLSQMSGNPLGTFILPSDMQYFAPTIQPGENIQPWMTVHAGETEHQRQVNAHHGEEPEELSLQGSLLSWVGGLDNHRLLTPEEAGHLSRYGGSSGGVSLPAYSNFFSDEGALFSQEILWQQNIVKVLGEVEIQARTADKSYRERKKIIEAHLRAKMKRYEGIKKHLQKLKTGSLKERLKTAESSAARSGLLYDVRNEKSAISQAIANTHANPAGPKGKLTSEQTAQIANWKSEDAHLSSVATALSQPRSKVKEAELKLIENDLKLEQEPIEQALLQYGGSKTSIGKGGELGVVDKYISTIKNDIPSISSKQAEAQGAITTLQTSLEEVTHGLELSAAGIAPVLSGRGEGQNASALLSIAYEKEQKALEKASIANAQFTVFKNFEANLPHYDTGGPVLKDGPIYAHKDEHVVPKDGALIHSGGQAPVFNVEHHISGELGPMIGLIDSRISHPDNIRVVSKHVAQNTRLLRR